MATPAHPKSSSAKREVTVFVDPGHPLPQPTTFNLCPLGLQFYSDHPMDEFQLIELEVDVPDAAGHPTKLACKGAVVRCQREAEPNRYRIWVKFTELPEGSKECIRCAAKSGQHLCTYCENF